MYHRRFLTFEGDYDDTRYPKSSRAVYLVVFRAILNQIGQEIKTLLFATEDPTVAHGECDRMNNERTSQERYGGGITYRIEKIPLLSRRKSRHPFMRGQQRELFNPDDHEKDGNTDTEFKMRGRMSRQHEFSH